MFLCPIPRLIRPGSRIFLARILTPTIHDRHTRDINMHVNLREDEGSANVSTAGPFNEERTSIVHIEGDDLRVFECEEEPHMLPMSMGGGYAPLQLGEKLKSGKSGFEYEIVRKLGWGASGSVWLAHCRCVVYVQLLDGAQL